MSLLKFIQNHPLKFQITMAILSVVLPILLINYPNIFSATFLLLLGLLLIVVGRKRQHTKLIFISFGLFIIFHLVIFPLVYLKIINNDVKSFAINDSILRNEKSISETDVLARKTPLDLEMKYLEMLIRSKNKNILRKGSILFEGNLIFLDSIFLYNTYEYQHSPAPTFISRISLARIDGRRILTFSALEFSDNDKQIKDILQDYHKNIKEKSSQIMTELKLVYADKFWTYLSILPYAINVYDTDNLNPILRSANYIYQIHKWIVPIVILSIFGLGLSDFQKYRSEN